MDNVEPVPAFAGTNLLSGELVPAATAEGEASYLNYYAPLGGLAALSWRAAGFAAAVLLLRRIPAWLLLRRWTPWNCDVRGALFAGWFGPIGAAALFYAMLIQDDTGSTVLLPLISLAIGASVLAHGIIGTPLTRIFGGKPALIDDEDETPRRA